jgi:hypothetical protein
VTPGVYFETANPHTGSHPMGARAETLAKQFEAKAAEMTKTL